MTQIRKEGVPHTKTLHDTFYLHPDKTCFITREVREVLDQPGHPCTLVIRAPCPKWASITLMLIKEALFRFYRRSGWSDLAGQAEDRFSSSASLTASSEETSLLCSEWSEESSNNKYSDWKNLLYGYNGWSETVCVVNDIIINKQFL